MCRGSRIGRAVLFSALAAMAVGAQQEVVELRHRLADEKQRGRAEVFVRENAFELYANAPEEFTALALELADFEDDADHWLGLGMITAGVLIEYESAQESGELVVHAPRKPPIPASGPMFQAARTRALGAVARGLRSLDQQTVDGAQFLLFLLQVGADAQPDLWDAVVGLLDRGTMASKGAYHLAVTGRAEAGEELVRRLGPGTESEQWLYLEALVVWLKNASPATRQAVAVSEGPVITALETMVRREDGLESRARHGVRYLQLCGCLSERALPALQALAGRDFSLRREVEGLLESLLATQGR